MNNIKDIKLNLLHRCLIEKVKNERIIQVKPLNLGFEEKNLFDCCLIGIRIQGSGLSF